MSRHSVLRTLQLLMLIAITIVPGSLGCQLGQPPVPVPVPSAKTLPVARQPLRSFRWIKDQCPIGITEVQALNLCGPPVMETGATWQEERDKYGDRLAKLYYQWPDGVAILFMVDGRMVGRQGFSRQFPTPQWPSFYGDLHLPPLDKARFARNRTTGKPSQKTSNGKRLYLLPISNAATALANQLALNLHDKFGLTVHVLSPIEFSIPTHNRSRRQVMGEYALLDMENQEARLAADSQTVVIGITGEDMYPLSNPNWAFEFGQRTANRFSIISTARMDPTFYGKPADPTLLMKRLRKMVLKYIAVQYFELGSTPDYKSVRYREITGLEALDRLGENL